MPRGSDIPEAVTMRRGVLDAAAADRINEDCLFATRRPLCLRPRIGRLAYSAIGEGGGGCNGQGEAARQRHSAPDAGAGGTVIAVTPLVMRLSIDQAVVGGSATITSLGIMASPSPWPGGCLPDTAAARRLTDPPPPFSLTSLDAASPWGPRRNQDDGLRNPSGPDNPIPPAGDETRSQCHSSSRYLQARSGLSLSSGESSPDGAASAPTEGRGMTAGFRGGSDHLILHVVGRREAAAHGSSSVHDGEAESNEGKESVHADAVV